MFFFSLFGKIFVLEKIVLMLNWLIYTHQIVNSRVCFVFVCIVYATQSAELSDGVIIIAQVFHLKCPLYTNVSLSYISICISFGSVWSALSICQTTKKSIKIGETKKKKLKNGSASICNLIALSYRVVLCLHVFFFFIFAAKFGNAFGVCACQNCSNQKMAKNQIKRVSVPSMMKNRTAKLFLLIFYSLAVCLSAMHRKHPPHSYFNEPYLDFVFCMTKTLLTAIFSNICIIKKGQFR